MFRLAPLVLILQVFCLYHAYSNKSEQKWYWIIMFFPVLGSLFYLYHHFYSRQNVANISTEMKRVINTNYDVERLEKKVKFSDTIANKSELADKYIEFERYAEAIELYESCLSGYNSDDTGIMTKLVKAYYNNQDYKSAVEYGDKLLVVKDFLKSEERIGYACSLFYLNELERSEKQFIDMDKSYTHYKQRLEYGIFLNQTDRKDEAIKKLEELMVEFQDMTSQERKFYRYISRDINRLHREVSKSQSQ